MGVHNNPVNHIDPLGLSEDSGWSWSLWDLIPGVQVVHALYDAGAAVSVPPTRAAINMIEAYNNGQAVRQTQALTGGASAPATAGGGMERPIAQFQDGANEAAGSVPGTSFTGPASGPSKVGYTPSTLERPLAQGAGGQAAKAAVGEFVDPAVAKATWYHGTSSTHLDSLAKGLNPESAGTAKGGVSGFFVTSDPEVAAQYAKLQALETGGSPVIVSAPGKTVGGLLDAVPNPHGGEMVIPKDKFSQVKAGTFKVDNAAMKKTLEETKDSKK